MDQTYANHRRFNPLYHFTLIPILAINVIIAIYFAVREPSLMSIWSVVMALALVAIALFARWYGLRSQDRIIRLEERVRLAAILPPDLRSRIPELHKSDLLALRFCPDDELPEITRRVLAREFKTRDEIKRAIKNWRPDYHRV